MGYKDIIKSFVKELIYLVYDDIGHIKDSDEWYDEFHKVVSGRLKYVGFRDIYWLSDDTVIMKVDEDFYLMFSLDFNDVIEVSRDDFLRLNKDL